MCFPDGYCACIRFVIICKQYNVLQIALIISEQSCIRGGCAAIFLLLQHKADIADLEASTVIFRNKTISGSEPDRILTGNAIPSRNFITEESIPIIILITDVITLLECTVPRIKRFLIRDRIPVVFVIQAQIVKMSRRTDIDSTVLLQFRNFRTWIIPKVSHRTRKVGIEIIHFRVVRGALFVNHIHLCIEISVKSALRIQHMIDIFRFQRINEILLICILCKNGSRRLKIHILRDSHNFLVPATIFPCKRVCDRRGIRSLIILTIYESISVRLNSLPLFQTVIERVIITTVEPDFTAALQVLLIIDQRTGHESFFPVSVMHDVFQARFCIGRQRHVLPEIVRAGRTRILLKCRAKLI